MQVKRQRRSDAQRKVRVPYGRRARLLLAGTAALAVSASGLAAFATTDVFGDQQVGSEYAAGQQVSADQVIKPLGDRLTTPFGKFMGSTVSPDGRFLAATSNDKGYLLQVFDLATYRPISLVGTKSAAAATKETTAAGFAGVHYKQIADETVGQEGPTYSPDGRVLWVAQAQRLLRFVVNADGTLGNSPSVVSIPDSGGHQALIGQSAYSADGSTLYVAVNGQNRVVSIDPVTGTILNSWATGFAPREIKVVGTNVYVSDEGGRPAKDGETTINSYGAQVPADPETGASTTGIVTVIDGADPGAPTRSVDVGLHPTAMYAASNALFVANTFDDTISVIDTDTDQVVQTISTQPWKGSQVGYQPNGIAMTDDGRLLVSLGRADAVAVYRYHGDPQEPVDFIGMVPTDYYPSDVFDVDGKIVVANSRGIDARGPELSFDKGTGTTVATGHGTHGTTASLTRFALPSDGDIRDTYTPEVFAQNGWGPSDTDVKHAGGTSGAHVPAVPVPARIGDPSTIKHVFLLVKENRTYDQIYGDMAEGNGDSTLAQFGEQVTPNQHALARQFGLYDNAYDIGTNSAEGHNWIMQGDDPEYTESSAGEYTRSYDTENDVLGHQRSGFLWTAVQAAGGSVRNYGEFTQFQTKPSGATWQKYYCAATSVDAGGDPAQLTAPSLRVNTTSPIPSLNAVTDHDSPKFDTSVPDIYRYNVWKQDFEQNGPASLNMFWLSSDHTGGTADPRAQVADGDLAVGKIVDEISHSKYWKDSAIFVVEDDSQNGADHVDGHRAPIQVISPWARHGVVDSHFYSQITVVRTIEQILGAEPLNQKVAAATPMYQAFATTPDTTPYDAVPNRVPLTEGVATPPACGLDTLGLSGAAAQRLDATEAAEASAPAAEQDVAQAWEAWTNRQRFTGSGAVPDYANPEQMNRYTWYQTHEWKVPYPGDDRIYAPSQVPGAALPGTDGDS